MKEMTRDFSRAFRQMLDDISASSETIKLLLGEEKIPFLIHKKILCENRPFSEFSLQAGMDG